MKNNSERSRSNEVRIPMELDEKQHLADESATLLLDKGLPASAVAVKIGCFILRKMSENLRETGDFEQPWNKQTTGEYDLI
ncbi:unnamed protein product [Anisakis simplex]|uniref:Type II toxin-antitoxin system VapB family antitoxin n=1 Tax=Anisakis simplex TaxID=6269 RepID=A0A0M3K0H4_ANISI|nr:unnamed protein product [Anisakis simplex]